MIFIVSSLTKGKSLKANMTMRASSFGKKLKISDNSFTDVVEMKMKATDSTMNNLSDIIIPKTKPSKLNFNGMYVNVSSTIMKKQMIEIGLTHSANFE